MAKVRERPRTLSETGDIWNKLGPGTDYLRAEKVAYLPKYEGGSIFDDVKWSASGARVTLRTYMQPNGFQSYAVFVGGWRVACFKTEQGAKRRFRQELAL